MAATFSSTHIRKIMEALRNQPYKTMLGNFSGRYGPFHMLISTILSARSRDEVTEVVAVKLFEKYPDAAALAAAKQTDVERIIKKTGFYHNKARMVIETAQKIVHEYDGTVPDTLEELMKLPGVGRKVGNCVLVYAFKKDAIPVDTHVHRISNRLGWVKTKTPEQTEEALCKIVPKDLWQVVNDFFVAHGKLVCKPITPQCRVCCISKWCKTGQAHS